MDCVLAVVETPCWVFCGLWPWNVFHSWLIRLHFLMVVVVQYSINSNRLRCLDNNAPFKSKHSSELGNGIHQSNFVSIRDQVNLCLSLTVIEALVITFFRIIKCNHSFSFTCLFLVFLEYLCSNFYNNWVLQRFQITLSQHQSMPCLSRMLTLYIVVLMAL